MPTSWILSIAAIFLGVGYGLIVWQRQRLQHAEVFLGEVKAELKKVTWPGRREIVNTTSVVLVTVFFFGVYLSLVDLVVGTARQGLFDALGLGG